jgi:hypothetical protein
VQRLQHQAIAAQCHDNIGLIGISCTIECGKSLQRDLRFAGVTGNECDGIDGFGQGGFGH